METINIWDLEPFSEPGRLEDTGYSRLAESIRERGMVMPIVIDQHNKVLDGKFRVLAARSIGILTVLANRVTVSEKERKFVEEAFPWIR